MSSSKNSADILQDFVGSLLTESDISLEPATKAPLKEVYSQNSISETTQIKALKLAPQPLLSERLNQAQTLLQAMPEIEDVEEKPVKEAVLPQVFATEKLLEALESIPLDEIVIVEEEILEDELQEDEIKSDDEIIIVEEAKQTIELESPLSNGIPEWGRGSFQTLIFNIGELKLALPLVKLGGIHRLESKLTVLPENPPWYLGLIADEFGSISVIDTAMWIMPEKYDVAKSKGLDYDFFVLLDDTRWGLACSKVDNAITLSEDDVRWNSKNSKRPWLAGMLVNEMCALLDVKTLIRMLDGDNPSTTI